MPVRPTVLVTALQPLSLSPFKIDPTTRTAPAITSGAATTHGVPAIGPAATPASGSPAITLSLRDNRAGLDSQRAANGTALLGRRISPRSTRRSRRTENKLLSSVCSVISVVNWSKIATRFAEQSAIEFPRHSLA